MMSILSKDRRNKMLYKLGLMKIAKAQMKKIDVIKNYRLYNNSNWFISYYKVKKLSKNYDSLFDNIKIAIFLFQYQLEARDYFQDKL